MFISELGRSLINSFKMNPTDWRFGEFYATHIPTDMQFWIANGAWFFNGSGKMSGTMGIFERHVVYRQLNKCRSRQAALKLENKNVKA